MKENPKEVKKAVSLKRELSKVQRLLKKRNLTDIDRAELRGAQQTLCWALNENAMSQSRVSGL